MTDCLTKQLKEGRVYFVSQYEVTIHCGGDGVVGRVDLVMAQGCVAAAQCVCGQETGVSVDAPLACFVNHLYSAQHIVHEMMLSTSQVGLPTSGKPL